MNDEIKEILDYLKNADYSPVFADEGCDDTPYKLFDETEVKLLLDYITNLQNENEDYKSKIEKAVEYINKYEVCLIKNGIPEISRTHLLNILQNGDNSND